MKITLRKSSTKITSDQLCAISFVLFFSMPLLKRILQPLPLSLYLSIVLTYTPVVLVLFLNHKRITTIDFFFLLCFVVLFFCVTYLFHPEYSYWYDRDYYGVWDYVLRPDNGIYAYFFIRNIEDPKKILKYLIISSWLMFLHLGLDFYGFIKRGYWFGSWEGKAYHSSYNLEFGYDLLLYELVFLYSSFRFKKPAYFVMSVVGFIMILSGGSRGPIIDLLLFLIGYMFLYMEKSVRKFLSCISLISISAVFYFWYLPLMTGIRKLLEYFGLSSRFVRMMLAGTIADGNGREKIWEAAIQMIKTNPWGYGAMGSRHVISDIILVGHPHNVILEILIDFGVFWGSLLIVGLVVFLIKIFRTKCYEDSKGVLIIFLGYSCMLLLSGTFWHRSCTWGLLAMCMNIFYLRKRGRLGND